ncbi:smad nuclear interacting protein 1 [Phlebotomus argentipes]|uniref:smad nuclear interacting protein 1 n=1 Tax=Phlebotomus argentipes TaxID=94469 RepID=UPI0028934049|nr:smad nuclear interacting protein 1 [Phlebotomus argentipes]
MGKPGKTSKKSKKHHKKRSSSEDSDSSPEPSPKRVAQREPENKHHRRRDASDDGKGVSSKWDSPEENASYHRRHQKRNYEPYRQEQEDNRQAGRRGNREQHDDRRDRPGKRYRHSPSPKWDPRDNRRRHEEHHVEDHPRRSRDEVQERGRRYRENREERFEVRREDRDGHKERFHDRERRCDDGKRRRSDHRSRSPRRNFPRQEEDDRKYEWGKREDKPFGDQKEPAEKEKPNFGLSGKLTEDTNKVNGVVIKYAEPQEARKPKRRWRLYPFKGETALPTMYIHRQSCFLIGRDHKVCDLRVDHPSCSKQHAALQYRLVPFEREDGSVGKRVRPYLIDLESSNGTFVNNNRIEARKYIELLEKDVIKFGFSSREYVLLHENSVEETLDDDVNLELEQQEIKTEPTE